MARGKIRFGGRGGTFLCTKSAPFKKRNFETGENRRTSFFLKNKTPSLRKRLFLYFRPLFEAALLLLRTKRDLFLRH